MVKNALSEANSASDHGSSIRLGMMSGKAVANEKSVLSREVLAITRSMKGLRNALKSRASATPKSKRWSNA